MRLSGPRSTPDRTRLSNHAYSERGAAYCRRWAPPKGIAREGDERQEAFRMAIVTDVTKPKEGVTGTKQVRWFTRHPHRPGNSCRPAKMSQLTLCGPATQSACPCPLLRSPLVPDLPSQFLCHPDQLSMQYRAIL